MVRRGRGRPARPVVERRLIEALASGQHVGTAARADSGVTSTVDHGLTASAEVLIEIARGLSNTEVAERLFAL